MKAVLYPFGEDYIVSRQTLGYGKFLDVYYKFNGEIVEVQIT